MNDGEMVSDGALAAVVVDGPGAQPPVAPEPAVRTSLVDVAERAVREWLRPGRFRPGDRLPTEEQLAGRLGISRGTLRSALHRLEQSGEIVRRQGSGTFVGALAPSTGPAVPWLHADSYDARARDGVFSVLDMSVEHEPVGESAASAFAVDPDRVGMQVRRVLSAGGVPVAISHDILHPDLVLPGPAIVRERLSYGGTVHAMIVAMLGIAFSIKRTRIGSSIIDPADEQGRRLGIHEPTACVVLHEVSTGDGRVVHWARDVVMPRHVEIEVVQSSHETGPEPVAARRLAASG